MAKKKSISKWEELCDGWSGSGLTQSKYCAEKSISVGSFKAHLYELRSAGKIASRQELQNKAPIFSKVTISEEKTFSPYCTLQFQNGEKVIIETESSLIFLKQLMGVK